MTVAALGLTAASVGDWRGTTAIWLVNRLVGRRTRVLVTGSSPPSE